MQTSREDAKVRYPHARRVSSHDLSVRGWYVSGCGHASEVCYRQRTQGGQNSRIRRDDEENSERLCRQRGDSTCAHYTGLLVAIAHVRMFTVCRICS